MPRHQLRTTADAAIVCVNAYRRLRPAARVPFNPSRADLVAVLKTPLAERQQC